MGLRALESLCSLNSSWIFRGCMDTPMARHDMDTKQVAGVILFLDQNYSIQGKHRFPVLVLSCRSPLPEQVESRWYSPTSSSTNM